MPFDGKTWKPADQSVFSLDSLIAWLETKDPAEEYNFQDPRECLVGQFVREQCGLLNALGQYEINGQTLTAIPWRWPAGWVSCAGDMPRNFGAALRRAKRFRRRERSIFLRLLHRAREIIAEGRG